MYISKNQSYFKFYFSRRNITGALNRKHNVGPSRPSAAQGWRLVVTGAPPCPGMPVLGSCPAGPSPPCALPRLGSCLGKPGALYAETRSLRGYEPTHPGGVGAVTWGGLQGLSCYDFWRATLTLGRFGQKPLSRQQSPQVQEAKTETKQGRQTTQ